MNNFVNQKKKFLVSSQTRNDGTSSDFRVKLSNFPYGQKFNRASIANLSIEKSYIQIDDTNNQLEFQETGGSAVLRDITLTNGNYTTDELCTMFVALLTTAFARAPVTPETGAATNSTYSYTISSSNVISISCSASSSSLRITFSAYLGPIEYDLIRYFGGDTTSEEDTISFNSPLVFQYPSNMQRYKSLYLMSDLAKNNNDQVLYTISNIASVPYNSTLYIENPNVIIDNVDIEPNGGDIFSFRLVDINQKVVDLRNQDISFELILWHDC